MDQDETWCEGRTPPWPHCVRWGPSSPSKKWHSPQVLAHVCCGQTAGWIKMPLRREVCLGPGDIVLDEDPAPPNKGHNTPLFGPCLLWPNGWIDQDAIRYGGRLRPRLQCIRWGPSSPEWDTAAPSFRPVSCGQTVTHLRCC